MGFYRGFDKPCCVNQQIPEIILVCLKKVDFNSAIMKTALKFSDLHVEISVIQPVKFGKAEICNFFGYIRNQLDSTVYQQGEHAPFILFWHVPSCFSMKQL